MDYTDRLLDLFQQKWKHSTRVVQKDERFMFKKNPTGIIERKDSQYLNVNCGDWVKVSADSYDTKITNNKDFADGFEELCKNVISKDFIMFRNQNARVDNWLNDFIEEQHGSGVTSLFWLYYQMRANDVKNIVIDNIDGFLHYLSMQQLGRIFRDLDGYKIIFLMYNEVLLSNYIMDIEDMYVLHGEKIANIQNCTDRELRPVHDLQKLYRAGEFDTILREE